MKNLTEQVVQTIKIFCLLGLALQVLLGLWYLFINIDAGRDMFQIILAFYSVYLLTESSEILKKQRLFIAAVINTNPFILQAHMSDYVYSLFFSVVILGLVCYRGMFKKNKRSHMLVVGIITAILIPIIMLTVTITGGNLSNMKSAIGMTAVERFAWPHLDTKYRQWMPEEVSDVFTDSDLKGIVLYPFRVESEWQPALEDALGADQAFEMNLQVAKMGMEQCTMFNVQNMIRDTLSYASPYLLLDNYLSGKIDSATSFNIQEFREKAPEFSSKYFIITYRLLEAMILLVIPYIAVTCYKKRAWTSLCKLGILGVWLLYFGFVLSLQGTYCFDYKQTLLQISLYYLPILYCLGLVKGELS